MKTIQKIDFDLGFILHVSELAISSIFNFQILVYFIFDILINHRLCRFWVKFYILFCIVLECTVSDLYQASFFNL